ncbi:conserved membrane hypothetical protein [Vibrio nigripulchritudo MADA3029]|nr:conserved membrane hypothetical protein [Vibrio nigripulchritudo MADA3020]CCN54935.1 conserved membrane hypothetical protein [Vibrio nigripulchritudo MADA3021]CCN60080.1 conserved membrane hypothetical protein [Vibrio nigripulchritudo MADA3029]
MLFLKWSLRMLEKFSLSLVESIYITLPILVLIIIKVVSGKVEDLILLSDTTIASCIVFGQLAVKFESLPGYKGEKRKNRILFTNLLRSFMLVSLIIYVCMQSIDNLSENIFIFGHSWFVFSMLCHIFFSQLAENIKEKI